MVENWNLSKWIRKHYQRWCASQAYIYGMHIKHTHKAYTQGREHFGRIVCLDATFSGRTNTCLICMPYKYAFICH
jgi:hypothetical protein